MIGPLSATRDDPNAPDYGLDHAHWDMNSHQAGCDVASEEALLDLERVCGTAPNDHARLSDDDFDLALTEGEAWGDLYRD